MRIEPSYPPACVTDWVFPGFSGSTPLCNAVLVGSGKDIEAWLSRAPPLSEEDTTFLGQSPLHLAVTNPDVCRRLVDAGRDLDATDKWGVTPLMYAAGMGQRQTVTLLLSSGADPTLYARDSYGHHRTFIHYAIARGHSDLVLDALDTISELYGTEALQDLSQLAVMLTISAVPFSIESRPAFLSKLFPNLPNINMSIRDHHKGVDNNTLLHYASCVEEASALVQYGFNQFNKPNSDGKRAISLLAQTRDPAGLVKFCLENGTDVNNKDSKNHTVLFDLLANLRDAADAQQWESLAAVRLCLDAGADIGAADDCSCPCSTGGCTMSHMFSLDLPSAWGMRHGPELLWSLEWATLVEEHRGVEAAREVLLQLLRRAQCDQSDIALTHTCCHRGRGVTGCGWHPMKPRPTPMADEDVVEIHDEESEFIAMLEDDMTQLASASLERLRLAWMLAIKAKYDAHLAYVDKARAEHKPQFRQVQSSITYAVQR